MMAKARTWLLASHHNNVQMPSCTTMTQTATGATIFLIYHVVFCLAQAATITRPHATHLSTGLLAQTAALGVVADDADGLHAQANVGADWAFSACVGRQGTGTVHGLINQVLKGSAPAFEAGRVCIGNIVRDDVNVGLLREHASRCDAKCFHVLAPFLLTISAQPLDRLTCKTVIFAQNPHGVLIRALNVDQPRHL